MSQDYKKDTASEKTLMDFRDGRAGHFMMQGGLDELRELVDCSSASRVIAVVGPEKSGRNTLVTKFVADWTYKVRDELTIDRGMIPLIDVVVPSANPKSIDVDWPYVFGEILRKAGQILIDNQVWIPSLQQYAGHLGAAAVEQRTRLSRTADRIRATLVERGTKVIILRNADRLFRLDAQRKSSVAIDTLLDLIRDTDIVLILVGTYDLVSQAGETGRWIDCKGTIHIRRYDSRDSEDMAEFKTVIDYFLRRLRGLEIQFDLSVERDADFLYRGSLGRVGALADWLADALSFHLRAGKTFDVKLLGERQLPNRYLQEILKTILAGEKLLLDTEQASLDHLLRYGLDDPALGGTATARPTTASAGSTPVTALKRIGERRPKRDPVGVDNDE